MRSVTFSSLVLIALAFGGCATDVANRYYGTVKYPAKPVDQVELLTSIPSRPYDVIADFQARGATPADMRKDAADIGADAVIVVRLGGYRSSSDEWAGRDSQSTSYTRIAGTAIKYK